MIKLTRGALTMLLAQYRGILKNAWIKNFAVAAALATSVSSAYADGEPLVTTWEQATSKDVVLNGTVQSSADPEYNGTLNLQSSAEIKGAQQITITGGTEHKIGDEDQAEDIVIDSKDESSFANLTINGKDSAATLTIANKTGEGAKTTGIWLNKVQVGVNGENTATLTVKTQPAWFKDGFKGDESNQADFTSIDTLDIGAKGTVAVDGGKLDVYEKLSIAKDGKLTNNRILWMGRDDETGNATEVKVDGTLTSTSELYLDSNKLTVGNGGKVEVAGILGLDNTNEVNINKELTDKKINLTGSTSVHASKLVLDADKENITSVVAGDLKLGSDKYANKGLVKEATVTKNLTALASKTEGEKTVPDTYKIGSSESIILDADYKHPCLELDNESRKGAVASNLNVEGTLKVQSGEWTAQDLKVNSDKVLVESNAALALKTLEIANGKTLSVKAASGEGAKAGVLDLTNTTLVNDKSDNAQVKGTIDNLGIVKIGGDTLAKAIANGENDKGYIFVNQDGAKIQVAGDATLETSAFLSDTSKSGIKNEGTLAVNGTLTVTDNDDVTLANAGTLSVDSLNINKSLNSSATLTVAKSVSTKGEDATLSGNVTLRNDGKVNGTVSGFKSVVAKITGLWDLGKANLGAAEINNASVSNVGEIVGAFIGGTTKATVTANTVKAASIKNGSTVTATTVNAAELSGESVLNADNVVATAAASAPISLTASTLNVGDITAKDGTADGHVAISAINGSTVKITGEYKAAENSLVANLKGSTLELDANKNISEGAETIRGDGTSTLVINGISGPVKLSTNTELGTSLADGADGTLAGIYKKIGVDGDKFTGQIKGLTYDTTGVVTDGKVALGAMGQYSTIASSTDAFASAQVTGVDNTALGSKLNVGSILANNGTTTVDISTGDIALNTATDGLLVAQAGAAASDPSTVADVKFSGAGKLALNGAGKVGNIDAGADGNGTLTVNADVTAGKIGSTNAIGELTVSSGTLTAKDVKAKNTTVDGNLVADSLTAATSATINGGLTLAKNADTGATGALSTAGALTTGKNAVVTAEDITVGNDSSLSGKVTALGTLTMGAQGLDIGSVDGAGAVTSTGDVSAKTLTSTGAVNVKAGSLSVTGDTATALTGALTVGKAGTVTFAKDVTLDGTTTVLGSLSANKVDGSGAISVKEGGKVNVAELEGSGTITVGEDGDNSSTGSIYAKTLKATGKIFIDPEFGQQAAFVGAEHLATDSHGIEVTTGDIVVGKNAALAVGVSSVDQARSVLSSLGLTDANGSFKQNGVENAIYTDALVKIASDKALDINSANNTGNRSSVQPIVGGGVLSPLENGQIHLADKSAVVIGKNAAAKSVKTGKAVLTAHNATVGVRATGNSKVIFAGNPTKQDIKNVKVFGNAVAGSKVFANDDEAAKVSVQLSPLYNEGKLTVDGGITGITVNRGYINTALYNASLPVKNLVAEVADTALTGDGVGSDFIMENALVDGGANIESAARLATFGGAYQAAAAAVNTGIDAAQARLGLGIDNSAEVKGEDISVWANAVYKNTESDSFEAQGANYGADLDLTSLVIGADYNMAEGSKVGAYATFGTGDVDGKGAGHNVKNDVDTYGFGIYGSAKLASGVSILSDVGYTVAQNEFKGIVNADADMKVFTAGANVKYTFNTQVADISPFVGARYTSFNLESYAVKSAKGIVAYTDADTAHIFSIPVGFDLSKQITAGEWNVKPAFTAKVTFNTGDKTVSSSTQFTGVKNALNLDAEVMDDVTYSVGASVSATKGAATFGAGLSYTGSSETNELSAQIGARYTF